MLSWALNKAQSQGMILSFMLLLSPMPRARDLQQHLVPDNTMSRYQEGFWLVVTPPHTVQRIWIGARPVSFAYLNTIFLEPFYLHVMIISIYLDMLVKNRVVITLWVLLWVLSPTLLIYMTDFVPILAFCYCGSVVYKLISGMVIFPTVLSSQDCFSYLWSSVLPYEFKEYFSYF